MTTFNVGQDVLGDEFTFEKISAWDSIIHMSLIASIEDVFDLMIDTEDILNFASYNNGKQLLKKCDIEI